MPSDVPTDVRQRADRYIVKADTTPAELAGTIMQIAVDKK